MRCAARGTGPGGERSLGGREPRLTIEAKKGPDERGHAKTNGVELGTSIGYSSLSLESFSDRWTLDCV